MRAQWRAQQQRRRDKIAKQSREAQLKEQMPVLHTEIYALKKELRARDVELKEKEQQWQNKEFELTHSIQKLEKKLVSTSTVEREKRAAARSHHQELEEERIAATRRQQILRSQITNKERELRDLKINPDSLFYEHWKAAGKPTQFVINTPNNSPVSFHKKTKARTVRKTICNKQN